MLNMKYDWNKIVNDQQMSGLSVKDFCSQNNIILSSFYKNKKKIQELSTHNDIFMPVEVIDHNTSLISLNIDGHSLEFDPSLLDSIIGALKLSSILMKSETSIFQAVMSI